MSLFPSSAIPAGSTGYDIDNSLRFNDDDSAYLWRTPSSSGNRRVWTYSVWIKRGALSIRREIFGAGTYSSYISSSFNSSDQLSIAGTGIFSAYSSAVFRDTHAWYHIVYTMDTGLSSGRLKIYVNGTQVTMTAESGYAGEPSQNSDTYMNTSGTKHRIGNYNDESSNMFDGYMAEIHLIDGTALTPTSFGETGDYGEWKAKKVSGLTYGTNGYHLDFETSSTLGNDANGSNNFTLSSIASTDQMLDTPTNNFCTLDFLSQSTAGCSLSEGNLKGYLNGTASTIWMESGKWYWEAYCVSEGSWQTFGIIDTDEANSGSFGTAANPTRGVTYFSNNVSGGEVRRDGNSVANYGSWTTGDIVGMTYDVSANSITFYLNGSSQGSITPNTPYDNYVPWFGTASGSFIANFGQDSSFAGSVSVGTETDDNGIGSFKYNVPNGFLALCTKNLPDPTVIPSEHFNTITYMGNGASTRSLTGVGFQPDFLWIKMQIGTWNHHLYDVVRGVGEDKALYAHNTKAEGADASSSTTYGYVSSLDTDGFTGTYTGSFNYTWNQNAQPYVVWNWKAGGADVLNEVGTIDSQVSANQDAGFSIATYAGNSTTAATVGHGLSKAPELVIIKNKYTLAEWEVYEASTDDRYQLSNTSAGGDDFDINYGTNPSATLVSLSSGAGVNRSPDTYVMYCWHSVDGYSKVGSYRGNSRAEGPFVYCGFRPAYILLKESTASGENWQIYDNKRDEYNPSWTTLATNNNLGQTSGSGYDLDMISSGFKIRYNNNQFNDSSSDYIFIAFAESPFKHTNAR